MIIAKALTCINWLFWVGLCFVEERVVPQNSFNHSCTLHRSLELECTTVRADELCLHVVIDVTKVDDPDRLVTVPIHYMHLSIEHLMFMLQRSGIVLKL